MPRAATAFYEGRITSGQECEVVRVDEHGQASPLPARTDLRNHSRSGFAWGYGGSGPAQLALAILADHLRDEERALQLYHDFKLHTVSQLEQEDGWRVTPEDVDAAVAELEAADAAHSPWPGSA